MVRKIEPYPIVRAREHMVRELNSPSVIRTTSSIALHSIDRVRPLPLFGDQLDNVAIGGKQGIPPRKLRVKSHQIRLHYRLTLDK